MPSESRLGETNVPFEVPSGWCWCRLEDIAYVASGSTPSKDSFVEEGVPYLKMYNLRNQKIDFQFHPQFIKSEVHKGKLARSIAKSGDLIMNIVGPPLGKLAIIPDELEECNFNQAAVMIRPYLFKNTINAYLFYYLSEMTEINSIATKGSAGQVNISLTQSQNMRIPLPPLAEQQRIIEEIEKRTYLFDIIEEDSVELQQLISKVKSKILNLAIKGKLVEQDRNDEPASELLKRINPNWQSTDTSQYEQLPNGWELVRLADLCSFLSRGKSPKYSDERLYPVFAQKCNLKEGGISLDKAQFLDPTTLGKWPEEYKLRTGDILINSTGTGTVGRTRLFNESVLGQYPFVVPDSHVSVVRTFDIISSEYIFAVISSIKYQNYIEDNLAGSTNQKELYIGVLEDMVIPLPPLSEQKRITGKIKFLFNTLDSISQSLTD